jgi:hypothetical protein
MKVLVLVKATAESEAGVMPSEPVLAAMGRFNEELVKAGVLLAAEGLHPSAKGKRVHYLGNTRIVMDGPFTETKELVAGFWLWQVKSIEEAVEWLKRCPNPGYGEWVIEARPVFEPAEFGDQLTPSLRAQQDLQRARIKSSDSH